MDAEQGSPVSDDGRGLKHCVGHDQDISGAGSPVSDDGRGLKLPAVGASMQGDVGSPVSDDGRGLKREAVGVVANVLAARPSAMTGAD